MNKPFVHLHVHTEYSILDGANRCEELAITTKKMGMNSVAITDHGVMYGCYEFYSKCKVIGVNPILGCEVYVEPNGHTCRDSKNQYHLILLAENEEGYHNLTRLVSIGSTEGFYYKPRIDHDLLAKYGKGIIASSACLGGEIPTFIMQGDIVGATARAEMYRDILGKDNFFLEIQHNSIPEQALVNKALVDIARRSSFELIATNDAHYLKQEDAQWHDVLLCVQTNSLRSDTNRLRFQGDDYYFRSPEEMWDIFGAELPDSLINTQKIADRCKVELKKDKYYLPEFPIPEGETLKSYLRRNAEEGLKKRVKSDVIPERYKNRLDYELNVIETMGFSGYFCIVADIVNAAKERNIPIGPGRGSAAGSITAWSLGITDLDPIKYNLLFERFLNPDRLSMPDIDTDVSDKRRDELIEYIVEKYGSDKVAQIITFGCMKSRGAITDVGRALGIPIPEVRKVTTLIPADSNKSGIASIPEAIEGIQDLAHLYKTEPRIKELLDIAQKIEGISRHCSQHPAGIVITPSPLIDMLPVRKFGEKQNVTQYSMDPVEALGLVKMDILGLKTLSVIEGALYNIQSGGKGYINLDEIPLDDTKTYEMLQKGETLGVFQLESTGMTSLVRRMKPDCFEDMIALVALYRPGPLESGMADLYIKYKHKEEPIHYLHPKLEETLKETYGVILYQEQVMQSAYDLAGFTLAEADLLRKAMGKKKMDVMAEQRIKFIKGAVERGVEATQAGEIFDKIEKFAGYGFNKSHSAAYALISYRTAWLKANYGPEFLASYLSSIVGSKMDVLGQYIRSVRDAGYPVLPPNINESKEDFTVVGDVIRLGLSAVAKAGHAAIENIIKNREEYGKFDSLWDFISRVDTRVVNKGVLENLIKAGAFDSIEKNRAKLFNSLPLFIDAASRNVSCKNQSSLFAEEDAVMCPEMPCCEDFSEREKLTFEKESMGLYISGHPFNQHSSVVKRYANCPLIELEKWQSQKYPVITAGLLSSVSEKYTKRGDPMGIIVIEDADTTVEVVLFVKQWAKYKPLLNIGDLVFIKGQPRFDRGISILADEVYFEDNYASNLEEHSVLSINAEFCTEEFFIGLFNIFKKHKGNKKILLKIFSFDKTIVSELKGQKIDLSEKLTKEFNEYAKEKAILE